MGGRGSGRERDRERAGEVNREWAGSEREGAGSGRGCGE